MTPPLFRRMLNIKPRYLVDETGRKTGAVLSTKDYRALMQRLEDREDTLELDRAVGSATSFRDYTEIRKDMQADFDGKWC